MPRVEALNSHHGVKIGGVEIRAPRRRVPGRAQAVNLCACEVRWPRRHCGERPPGGVGLADLDVELTVVSNLGVGLQEIAAVERNDVGVDFEGDDGGGGFGELLHDEELGAAVLEEEEEESVPNDALQDHHLHHEAAGFGDFVAVHGD